MSLGLRASKLGNVKKSLSENRGLRLGFWCSASLAGFLGHKLKQNYSLPQVDRTWPWVCSSKITIYPIFFLLKGDYVTRKLPRANRKVKASHMKAASF